MLLFSSLALSLTLPLLALGADQVRFPNPSSRPVLTPESNARLSDLALASFSAGNEGFTTVEHKDYPKHSVRIKKHEGWCDPDVKSVVPFPSLELACGSICRLSLACGSFAGLEALS
jgi:hypothetical protein